MKVHLFMNYNFEVPVFDYQYIPLINIRIDELFKNNLTQKFSVKPKLQFNKILFYSRTNYSI